MLSSAVGAGERRVIAIERHLPFILPMPGRKSRSIISGIRFMDAVFDSTTVNSAPADAWFTSRRRRALSLCWRAGCSILSPCAGMDIGAPPADIAALTDLHRLLAERGFRCSSADPRIGEEKQNEQVAASGSGSAGAILGPVST